jgi:gliding motility-associated-like protein
MITVCPKQRFCALWVVFLLMVALQSHGQLCTGSLGDPVININFSPGSILPVAPGYTYTSSSCPNDGFYTVTGSSSGCFGGAWHQVSTDHTVGGSFMLVNASYTPGDFFVSKVSGLCPSTTYEFAAWMMNVLRNPGIKPNLVFSIETPTGTVLQQFATGDIPETAGPEWKQYGFYFSTPPDNAEIVLRIRNNAPGGIGNDIALDDITFRPCGPKIIAEINGYGSTVDVCEDSAGTYTLTADVSTGFSDPVYFWQISPDTGKTWKDIPGASSLTYQASPHMAGTYYYRLSVSEKSGVGNGGCRVSSSNLSVNIHGKPLVDAGPDRTIFSGDTIILQATVSGQSPTYLWTPPDDLSDPLALSPLAYPNENRTYTLLATTQYGCFASDEVFVKAVTGIFVPNAFTPNNDGLNDRWHIPFLDPVMDALVLVFNVYGQEVYRAKEALVDWDGTFNGKKQPSGTYIYRVLFSTNRKPMYGTFILIR